MIEIVLGIALCVVMGKIASADNQSPWVWGIVTFVLCAASLLIPLPFLRIGIAGAATFIGMIVYKSVRR